MHYFRKRYYDSELGRFTTPDPIISDYNAYGYCRQNPVMRSDPTGLGWVDDIANGIRNAVVRYVIPTRENTGGKKNPLTESAGGGRDIRQRYVNVALRGGYGRGAVTGITSIERQLAQRGFNVEDLTEAWEVDELRFTEQVSDDEMLSAFERAMLMRTFLEAYDKETQRIHRKVRYRDWSIHGFPYSSSDVGLDRNSQFNALDPRLQSLQRIHEGYDMDMRGRYRQFWIDSVKCPVCVDSSFGHPVPQINWYPRDDNYRSAE